MTECRHCGSKSIIKKGRKDGQQKWICKECGKYQGAVDRRIKYSENEKKMAVTLYLEGNGFRRIARILTEMFNKQFRHQTVTQWIKKAAQKVEESIEPLNETIEILEMDELYTFYKKKESDQSLVGSKSK